MGFADTTETGAVPAAGQRMALPRQGPLHTGNIKVRSTEYEARSKETCLQVHGAGLASPLAAVA